MRYEVQVAESAASTRIKVIYPRAISEREAVVKALDAYPGHVVLRVWPAEEREES